jgi:hypothetical protein
MTNEYTIQLEGMDLNDDWRVIHRWADVTDERPPSRLCDHFVERHWIADGADGRVRVWLGHNADPDSKPASSVEWNDYEP